MNTKTAPRHIPEGEKMRLIGSVLKMLPALWNREDKYILIRRNGNRLVPELLRLDKSTSDD